MIDRAEFAKVMGVFADRIGRPLAPATAEVYLDVLSDALTTEEFLAGARIVFRTHQFNTWPAPEQFIAAVKPQESPELQASEMYGKIQRAIGSVYDTDGRWDRIRELGPIAERALRAAGGIREFLEVMAKDEPFLRKRFEEAYVDAVKYGTERDRALAALDRGALAGPVAGLVSGLADRLTMPKPKPARSVGRDLALPPGDRE